MVYYGIVEYYGNYDGVLRNNGGPIKKKQLELAYIHFCIQTILHVLLATKFVGCKLCMYRHPRSTTSNMGVDPGGGGGGYTPPPNISGGEMACIIIPPPPNISRLNAILYRQNI